MKSKNKKRGIIITIAVILALWLIMGLIDYTKVIHCYEKPVFCILDVKYSYQDGGSGRYYGLGYSFDIRGNFMPEDELQGITEYTYYVLGIPLRSAFID